MQMPARSRAPLLALAAVVVGVTWLGCASSETDPLGGGVEPDPSGTTTTPTPTTRPDFEAGFVDPDSGSDDPTPDGGGDTCVDNGDPGGTQNLAKALPDTDDAQNSPKTVTGVLNGPLDVDFYKFHVADTSGHLVEADIKTVTSGIELCVYVKCLNGTTTYSGCTGGVESTSDIGTKGCCATGPSTATPGWDCSGITDNDSADVVIRVKQTQNKCTPYSFSYAF
jgi:hypothetical protein